MYSNRSGSGAPWLPIIAVILIAIVTFWGRIRAFLGNQKDRPAGRWIRDRSLGGKMVFIPDEDDSAAGRLNFDSALPEVSQTTRESRALLNVCITY
jgi:hypothetical protein